MSELYKGYKFIDLGFQIAMDRQMFAFFDYSVGEFVTTSAMGDCCVFSSYQDFDNHCDLSDRKLLLSLIPEKYKL